MPQHSFAALTSVNNTETMIVLSTDRAELHYFPTPDAVPGGYAILSHVWDESEETFLDLETIAKVCKENSTNPRDHVSQKIRECCILAEKHGYSWIWDDTCCIDKRSSTDLSEAINSMFRYYSLSQVCYAYLGDVPSDDDPHTRSSAFRKSRWHERGWTLQELIAPHFLIFVSKDWRVLDGRAELADVLEEITRIPAPLLRLETKVSDYSVAQRMSWAAQRETTREEDRAYSLMGIFGIHMPTLYGEGTNAFRRLQEEIMRQSVDPSLFLWGGIDSLSSGRMRDMRFPCNHERGTSYLLATSPYEFSSYGHSSIEFLPFSATGAMAASNKVAVF